MPSVRTSAPKLAVLLLDLLQLFASPNPLGLVAGYVDDPLDDPRSVYLAVCGHFVLLGVVVRDFAGWPLGDLELLGRREQAGELG
jgi:hypothetical protein